MRQSCFAKVGLFNQDRKVKIAKLFTENILLLNAGRIPKLSIANMSLVTWQDSHAIAMFVAITTRSTIDVEVDDEDLDDKPEVQMLATGACYYQDDVTCIEEEHSAAIGAALRNMLTKLSLRVKVLHSQLLAQTEFTV